MILGIGRAGKGGIQPHRELPPLTDNLRCYRIELLKKYTKLTPVMTLIGIGAKFSVRSLIVTTALNHVPVPFRHLHCRVEDRILGHLPPLIHPELFLHSHLEGESGRVDLVGAAFEELHTLRHRRR